MTSFPSSLPSLRPLLDVYYLPLTNMRIARTFCFANNGQALYLVSPTEIQRLTYSQETCENLQVSNKTLEILRSLRVLQFGQLGRTQSPVVFMSVLSHSYPMLGVTGQLSCAWMTHLGTAFPFHRLPLN